MNERLDLQGNTNDCKEEIKGFKDTIEWYNQNAAKYADSTEKLVETELINKFTGYLPINATILDAGCGAGRDTAIFTQEKFDATGLDISTGLINEARKRHPKSKFVEGNLLKLPFEDGSFNGIWANASLLHLETSKDVEIAISEFYRVLKNGGILHLSVKAQTGVDKFAVVKDSLSGHDRFFQYFQIDELTSLLHEQGFEVVESEQYKETDKNPKGRPEVEWINFLSLKLPKAQ